MQSGRPVGRSAGWRFGGLLVVLILGGAVLAFLMRKRHQPLEVAAPAPSTAGAGRAESSVHADYVVVGGIRRRRSDIQAASGTSPKDRSTTGNRDALLDYGRTAPVPADANPQVASVAEAIRRGVHPERVSPLIAPAAFDAESFAAEPDAYLSTVEPGRVFQVAQPDPQTPVLARVSPYYQQALQGEEVVLEVRAPPEAPVSFTSFDLGEFENRLTSITVQADSDGIAAVRFKGGPGTIEDVNILAGSPLASGQVKFVVNVQLPQEGGAPSAQAENP